METLLRTKLYIPPLRADLVPRVHLHDRLNQGASRKLTLVSAPAGFGKSTLVAGWLAERRLPAAWLSLDPSDNDPVRFWTYLIAAIQTIHQDAGGEARQIVSAPQLRSTEPVVISLINDISQLDGDLIVVLDDYHLIEAGQIHESLSYLLEHQPPNLHLILITRADPAISLARLRAHGRLAEIRAVDLQFSAKEAAILFNELISLDLKPAQVEKLNRRAEGWIVGLNLAALTLKGQAVSESIIERFTGSHQFILDYLTEEVVEALPETQRQFLLRTSILDRFCAASCAAVTGNQASQQLLDELRSAGLFLIPLDVNGTWFRYHHLFAEVLYSLLKRNHPDEVAELHRRAAAWFEQEGHSGEAVDHALGSQDMLLARSLVLKHGEPLLHRGEVATVQRWLDGLPEEMKREDPSVALACCWTLFLGGQNSAIEPQLEQANQAYRRLVDDGSLTGAERDLIAAQLAMMRSVLARGRGDHTRSVAHAEEAARLMPPEMVESYGTQWNMLAAARGGAGDFDGAIEAHGRGIRLTYAGGNLISAYGSVYGQVMYMIVQGRLNEAERICRPAIDRAASDGHEAFPAAGWLHIALARIHLERFRLEEASLVLNDGMRMALPGGFSEVVRSGRYLRAHLAAARGELDAAQAIFKETARIVNAIDDPYLSGELSREWAMLYFKAGDLEAVREKLRILEEKMEATQHAHLKLGWRWLLPRLRLAEERYPEALSALGESIDQARAGRSNGELIRLLPLRAVALEAMGQPVLALEALGEAVVLGAAEGYIWRWLEAGPAVEPLLYELRSDGEKPLSVHSYLDALLNACRTAYGESSSPRPGKLPDSLTPRELEIMRLIGQGYSNPEIAGQLVVSVNTIKKHTSNIYGKLGVRSRTQAIGRAQDLGLF